VGQPPRDRREHSLGSGVIVNPDGYILTNNHVVEGASDVQVTLSDKRAFKASITGTDPRSDIAVLKIPATKLPSITLGNSSKIRVGGCRIGHWRSVWHWGNRDHGHCQCDWTQGPGYRGT